MDPVSTLTGILVSNLVGFLFGGGNQNQGEVLETFLETLTTSFTNRVENVVRDAFTEQNFLEIKADIMSGATAFRTFRNSGGQDEYHLGIACHKIIEARSRIFAASELIISRDLQYMRDESIERKGAATLQHNRAFQAAFVAIQAVAALDVMVFGARVVRIPALRREAATRLTEYINRANELKTQYLLHQSRRTWVRYESQLQCYDGGEGVGYHCTALCRARRFLDGNVIDSQEQNICQIDPRKYEQLIQPFNERVTRRHVEDRSVYNAAVEYLERSPGNIQTSINTWTELQTQFNRQPGQ